MCENNEMKKLDLEGLEGLRGDGEAKWYVVHTYSGHENKVKVNIEKIVENRGMQNLILDVIVPTEDRVEVKNGQRKVKTRKMFPGYVLVKMIVTNESWYLVRNTQGVTGFVGHGSDPIPLTMEEVRRMGIEKIYIDLDIDVGDTVKVINGPFENFMGVVEETDTESKSIYVRKRHACRVGFCSGGQTLVKYTFTLNLPYYKGNNKERRWIEWQRRLKDI